MSRAVSVVAIVGRANVGKSSLFNALIGSRESIVAVEPGTTRDKISAKASYGSKDFWLVDTAGMKPASDRFELSIQDQIREAAGSSDLVLVVVEAHISPTSEDRQVAKMALKSRKPVILVVNKIDKQRNTDISLWRKLGIKTILATSTTQRTGISQLLGTIGHDLPRAQIKEAKNRLHLAILGRPNVGKSSLFNCLAAKQKALVAEQAGTTRDVNRLVVWYHDREIELADTAGIRRSGKIERGVEHFSVLRALSAIEQSDICLLVMDATELNTQLDQKIAGIVKDAGKGLILAVNKWDIAEDRAGREDTASEISTSFPFVPWAPLIFISALTGYNVSRILDIALKIDEERHRQFKADELNQWLRRTVDSHEPPPVRSILPRLEQIEQEKIAMPSFKIFGHHIKYLHWSYRRYLERQFRESWPLDGTPIKFWFIDKR